MSRNLFIIVLLIITPFCGWGQVDTIADQKLQEVVIMAKLPTVEMKPGKMTYRLDASITQSQGNVYDVLTSLPGVVIQNDGTIFLNGQNGANILMDGKPTYLSGQDQFGVKLYIARVYILVILKITTQVMVRLPRITL